MAEVMLRRKAWCGDEDFRLDLPDAWDVTVLPPQDAPALSQQALREAFDSPIGSPRLREIARGKTTAVVITDDLSRPTPSYQIVPSVLEELHAAGIKDENIRFLIGAGAHRPLTREELAKKLGADVVERYDCSCHNVYSGDLVGMGNLPDGTPIFVNPIVAAADVRIGVGGLYPHNYVGLSGGAKIILPGVVGITTINYNHSLYPQRGRGRLEAQAGTEDMRHNMEHVGRHVRLDFLVNVVMNSKREIAGAFTGDMIEAQRAGARVGASVYTTRIPQQLAEAADLVLVNSYPQDYDPVQVAKSSWPWDVFKNAYKVIMCVATDGILFHGWTDNMDYARFQRTLAQAPDSVTGWDRITSRDQMIVLSEGFRRVDFPRRHPQGALFARWPDLLAQLQPLVPQARVVVLPCAPIQVPEIV